MRQNRSLAIFIFVVILGVVAALAYARFRVGDNLAVVWIAVSTIGFALVVDSAIQVKENAAIVIFPSRSVESMQLGGLTGTTALTMGLGQYFGNGHKEGESKK
jgi:hypothetical protein